MKPIQAEFYLCPSLQMSCCSIFDQLTMYNLWHDTIRPKLVNYFDSLALKMTALKNNIKELFKVNITPLIAKLETSNEIKEKITNKYVYLKEINLESIIDNLIEKNIEQQKYMIGLKSTFFCTLCNFENQQYINTSKKNISIKNKQCKEIALNTINYAQYLNLTLNTELMYLSKVLTNFSFNKTEQPVKIKNLSYTINSIRKCYTVVKTKSKNFKKCKEYCQLFNYNSNSPVYEGDPMFYSDIITQIEQFIKAYGHLKKGANLNERMLGDNS